MLIEFLSNFFSDTIIAIIEEMKETKLIKESKNVTNWNSIIKISILVNDINANKTAIEFKFKGKLINSIYFNIT